MNIIEAIRSGKLFKRPKHDNWYTYADGFLLHVKEETELMHLTQDSILANDWEVEIIDNEKDIKSFENIQSKICDAVDILRQLNQFIDLSKQAKGVFRE